MKNMIDYFD